MAVAALGGALVAGCGAAATDEQHRDGSAGVGAPAGRVLGPRYGVSATLPRGWDGVLARGALHAATFPVSAGLPAWDRHATDLREDDVVLSLFENEPRRSPPLEPGEYPSLEGRLGLEADDFHPFDGVTEDSRVTGHGYARRVFRTAGRFFVLFAESGARVPEPRVLDDLNALLGSLTVEPGDFFPWAVEPARFQPRPGWFLGTSGPDEARAEGEFTTSWASTIPYEDEWNALPMTETLRRLPADGIVIWVSLMRSNRLPPRETDPCCPARRAPFRLGEFERRETWQGQVGDISEYVLSGTVGDRQRIDVRVYFGRRDPTDAMRAEAERMLAGLHLPDWGAWETE